MGCRNRIPSPSNFPSQSVVAYRRPMPTGSPPSLLLAVVVETSDLVAKTAKRTGKIAALATLVSACPRAEVALLTAYLTGSLPQGRIGIGPALLHQLSDVAASDTPILTLAAVDDRLGKVAVIAGAGSTIRRRDAVAGLLGVAAKQEQRFLRALLFGELRQGALEGVLIQAVAKAFAVTPKRLQRAVMLAGGLPEVAGALAVDGSDALARYRLTAFVPVRPMLAQPVDTLGQAIALLPGPFALEQKLDGARIQVHKDGAVTRVFTRHLKEVTAALPEVVELVAQLPASRLILDGEVIAFRPDGRPRPFQETMRRFGRRRNVAEMRSAIPLTPVFFDCLCHDDAILLDASAEDRRGHLERTVPAASLVTRLVTDDHTKASDFVATTLSAGHEGVMLKSLDAPYAAGSRGKSWLKLKQAHTLDLVVLAVEWGSGRRKGWLSNLHLGARRAEVSDAALGDADSYVMLGKTFKGLTDAVLRWQTEALLSRETHRTDHVVHVRPELVVEIAFNDVQMSPRYPGGLALRFARVKGFRPDKTPRDADTLDTVRKIYEVATSG
ncbi:MAG: DNA ligase-1 [Myxococcota bacterium]|jgi:DNA ligase-1